VDNLSGKAAKQSDLTVNKLALRLSESNTELARVLPSVSNVDRKSTFKSTIAAQSQQAFTRSLWLLDDGG